MTEGSSPGDISSLTVARRMMVLTEQAELRRKNPHAETKNLKEVVEEDQAMLGQQQSSPLDTYTAKRVEKNDQTEIRLRDLISQWHELNKENKPQPAAAEAIAYEHVQVDVQLNFIAYQLEPVDGLVRRSRELAETDRYLLQFENSTSFKITDKWTNRSTRIWGDPHVDTNDQAGDLNGEFSDLKESNSHTTLKLLDGTSVTFTARDDGLIEQVDVNKGSQHLKGFGEGYTGLTADNSLFASAVDTAGRPQVLGDVVSAGGDGNDWYNSAGKMVWGKTTGAAVTTRPSYVMAMEYRQSMSYEAGVISRGITA